MIWLGILVAVAAISVFFYQIYNSSSNESIAYAKPKKYQGYVERIGSSGAGLCEYAGALHVLLKGEHEVISMEASLTTMALTIPGDFVEFTKVTGKERCETFENKTLALRLGSINEQATA